MSRVVGVCQQGNFWKLVSEFRGFRSGYFMYVIMNVTEGIHQRNHNWLDENEISAFGSILR